MKSGHSTDQALRDDTYAREARDLLPTLATSGPAGNADYGWAVWQHGKFVVRPGA